MKAKDLQTPKNSKSLIGKPMLFAVMPVAKLKVKGKARIEYNILTGDYFITGQKNSVKPYILSNLKQAINLMLTINHYNKTDDKKTFKNGSITMLELT